MQNHGDNNKRQNSRVLGEEQDLINKAQHGFRSGRSCCTQLLEVTQDWADAIEDKKPVDVIYLDYRKAFDSVPFERLLVKLYAYGIRVKLLQWIREFLTNRKQKVSVNNHSSNLVPVTSGIPQGGVLGPIMFLIYVNDLPEVVTSTVKLFADDTKLYRVIKNEEDKLQLQEHLKNLQKWSEKWQLPFTVEKCKVLHLGPHNEDYNYTLKSGTNLRPLEVVTSEKDLGITFDRNTTFHRTLRKM